jgi:muramidase (phage lysozyme)
VVRKGDTLGAIAKRHNMDAKFLASINSIANPNVIRPGQNMIITQAPSMQLASPAPVNTRPVSPQANLPQQPAAPAPVTPSSPALLYGRLPPAPHYIMPFLNSVRRAESRTAGYNTMVGSPISHKLVKRNLANLGTYQGDYRAQAIKDKNKFRSTAAAGAYQILPSTMRDLISKYNLDPNNTIYDEKTQDSLAYALMKRRGLDDYLAGKLPLERFRVNIGKEWAGLPAIGNRSYYAGDKLNKANISEQEYLHTLQEIKRLFNKR